SRWIAPPARFVVVSTTKTPPARTTDVEGSRRPEPVGWGKGMTGPRQGDGWIAMRGPWLVVVVEGESPPMIRVAMSEKGDDHRRGRPGSPFMEDREQTAGRRRKGRWEGIAA